MAITHRSSDRQDGRRFCETHESLRKQVTDFLAAGLLADEKVVVIASEAHRRALVAELQAQGVDTEHLVSRDAQDTLAAFMSGTKPVRERFDAVIGSLLVDASHRRVRTYGEMVDLLWRAGNPEGALLLEEFWNELAERHRLQHLFAYGVGHFYTSPGQTLPTAPVADAEAEIALLRAEIAQRDAIEEALRRSVRELSSAHDEADSLFRVAESLNGAGLDLESVVQRVTDEATALLGAKFGAFFYNMVDERGETYLLYTLSGAPKEAFSKLGIPRATPIFAPTFRGDEGVVRLDDVTTDPRYGKMGPHHGMPAGHLPVRSYLAVSVISRSGKVHGGLFFGHPEPGRFSEQHERMIKALASQAAVAIDNAQLLKASVEAADMQGRLVDELTNTVRVNELFTGVLAHDLRNPLGAIMNAAQLLVMREQKNPQSTSLRPLTRIVSSGERMVRMIEQLLDFTRVRMGKGILIESAAGDMVPLVRHVADEFADAHADRAIVLEDEGETQGSWDHDRLSQVFSNLIGNALSHGEPDSKILVRIDGTRESTVAVSVNNRGAIPSTLIPQLFEPLISGEPKANPSQGLGLGLFITRHIAEAHGGQVQVTSTDAEGTTFTVSLPRFATSTVAQRGLGEDKLEEARDRAWETEQRMRLLVDSVANHAIFMLDRQGRVTTWNAAAARIKGYTKGEILGKHGSIFYPGEDGPENFRHALQEAEAHGAFTDQGWRTRKDGTRFWADVTLTAMRNRAGELIGFAKITRDLTEQRTLEKARMELLQAEEAIRMRDEFLSIVSHELKTPLTGLLLQLDTLAARLDGADDKVALKLTRATRSTQQLVDLVESLFDVSRIATGRFELSRERFDLAEALEGFLESLRANAERAGSTLSTSVDGPLIGEWDRARVGQIVTNLVANALKYGAGRPVEISLRRSGDQALLMVRDQGPGIDADDLARIFDRFERASSMRHYGGLGLGLYLVRELTQAHGGTVSIIDSNEGGTCFRVVLPLTARTEGG
jgi:PAS domain S-box-containing protein